MLYNRCVYVILYLFFFIFCKRCSLFFTNIKIIIKYLNYWVLVLVGGGAVAVWPVRDCGRFPIKVHEKLKRSTNLCKPLKTLLAIRFVCAFVIICQLFVFLPPLLKTTTLLKFHLLLQAKV